MLTRHRPRRLISIAHSYAVALNRRLVHEMARIGSGDWEVTAVAPSFFHGDLRPIPLERLPQELCRLEAMPAYLTNRIHWMLYGRRLGRILRQPWDVVHCWEEPYLLCGGQVAWWTPRRAALVYATFQNIPKQYPPPFQWIERYALARAAGWIAFGRTIDQALMQKACYQTRARRTIPLGVDLERFYPDPSARRTIRNELGWAASGSPVVGYLGRFVPEKGLDKLTQALDSIPAPWRALFIGGGPMEKALREWGRRHGSRVRIVTEVKHDQVPAYLNAMDVLCAPSQTTTNWREQLGRMLIEAFACGVPVVAGDSGEIPHVVEDAGVILGEKDVRQWAMALTDLLENPSRRTELAARGLKRARATFAWPIIARRHLAFFGELLDGCRNGGKDTLR
jgi:glycosyltransferase involved in cell wall biosynthesis